MRRAGVDRYDKSHDQALLRAAMGARSALRALAVASLGLFAALPEVALAQSGAVPGAPVHACIGSDGVIRVLVRCSEGEQAVGLEIVPLAQAAVTRRPPASRVIRDHTITGEQVKPGSLPGSDISPGTLPASALRPHSITSTQLASSLVGPTYSAGSGLTLSGTTFSLDPTFMTGFQKRVNGSCQPGQSLQAVNADGSVVCQTPAGGGTITGVTAGTGLTGGGGSGNVSLGISTPLVLSGTPNPANVGLIDATATGSDRTGIAGRGTGAGTGVFGQAGSSTGGTGLVGFDNGAGTYAGRFQGDVNIAGSGNSGNPGAALDVIGSNGASAVDGKAGSQGAGIVGESNGSGTLAGLFYGDTTVNGDTTVDGLTTINPVASNFAEVIAFNQFFHAGIYLGAGDPNGNVIADPGSLYLNFQGSLWVKQSGVASNMGWVSK